MAQAKNKIVVREVVTTVHEEVIVLELSHDEAETIRTLIAMTCAAEGRPNTDFSHAIAVRRALESAGVFYSRTRASLMQGSVVFR